MATSREHDYRRTMWLRSLPVADPYPHRGTSRAGLLDDDRATRSVRADLDQGAASSMFRHHPISQEDKQARAHPAGNRPRRAVCNEAHSQLNPAVVLTI